MVEFFKDGGWSMFILLLFGVLGVAGAGFFAARPDRKHEGYLKWMSAALLWATLAGAGSCLAAVWHNTAGIEDANERSRIVQQGYAESMSPVIMGFAFLAVMAFLGAIGRRRLDARGA
jgi:MFS family permease